MVASWAQLVNRTAAGVTKMTRFMFDRVTGLWPLRGSILALILSSAVHLLLKALTLGWVALRIRAYRRRFYC